MSAVIETAWLARRFPGTSECGDRHLVATIPSGVLITVVDGLGHGREAAEASLQAIEEVRRLAGKVASTIEIVRRCDEALHNTRGATMALCFIDRQTDTLTWLAIGNVHGCLLAPADGGGHSQRTLLTRSGVVGYNLPELHPTAVRLRHGDLLILATDGIQPGFANSISISRPVEESCKSIMSRYGRTDDDALLVVARYLG